MHSIAITYGTDLFIGIVIGLTQASIKMVYTIFPGIPSAVACKKVIEPNNLWVYIVLNY